ncbi:MAG: hypothetical protein RMK18_02115 [Armatimonadota bacterium]|nr:hypothetical protein [Armatimonadota bacterium]MDW8024652.1 hypothetical protein [Armatimonadota bacterium]
MLRNILILMALVTASCNAYSQSIIVKRSIAPDASRLPNLLKNESFEIGEARELPFWRAWKDGYEVDGSVARTGRRSVKCTSNDPKREFGIFQTVELNQREPTPIVAECWSMAKDVSGTPTSGYSLYLDIIHMDGTPLWGQNSPFDCGSHGWQVRRVTVIPDKPIKSVNIYALFRGHTGTVWFDDLKLIEFALPEGTHRFDGATVATVARKPLWKPKTVELRTDDGLALRLDTGTGQVVTNDGIGGFYIRDVAAASDFRQPVGKVKLTNYGAQFSASDEELKLRLRADFKVLERCIRVDGEVEDLSGTDRAVTVYFALPLNAVGWFWSNDIRRSERIEGGREYINSVNVGAGANGRMSWYPLGVVSGDTEGICLAIPLDVPRLFRIAYNSASREMYCAFDLGLSQETVNFPSRASFSFLIYRFEPRWRMRSALQKFYELFREAFVKRVDREGIWMPFTDIATVRNFEDFGFAFHEGDNNVPFDEQHGIYSFVYVEPMSHWLPLPKETPRTYEAVIETLKMDAKGEGGELRRQMAIATFTSGVYGRNGQLILSITKAPWCDGALILLNPDPDIELLQESYTKASIMLQTIEGAFERPRKEQVKGWQAYGAGFSIDGKVARTGRNSIRCSANRLGMEFGISQTVVLNQKEPKPLLISAWSKAQDVTGKTSADYSIYVDLIYDDGTPHWGLTAEFETGTHDWMKAERLFHPKRPVARATVYLLFRRTHTGTVWFDDAFFGEAGGHNLLINGSFEELAKGELDGVYLDSLEMGATILNYRREHWRYANVPLVFDAHGTPCQLLFFSVYEFSKWLAERMHGQGKLMFANAVLQRFPFAAHLFDVMGVEVNWMRGTKYEPTTDERMCYWRALSYRKPYCLLMNTNYERFTREFVERYMKRCAFYAIFPSMFDEEAASKDPYWASPKKWYERDRDLFKRYIPLIKALAKAGWEPVTNAWTDNEKVYVERYGASDEVFFTLLNDSDAPQEFTLAIDATTLRLDKRTKVVALNFGEQAEATMPINWHANTLTMRYRLPPDDVLVLKLTK